MRIGVNLHASRSRASVHKPEHWEQCIIYQKVMSKADGSAGNDCPWMLDCNIPVSTTFYFLVSSFPYATSRLWAWPALILETWWPCISKAHKCENRQDLTNFFTVFLVILMMPECYQVRAETVILWALPLKFPGHGLSQMLSTRNSASHLTDILLLMQWFIIPQR